MHTIAHAPHQESNATHPSKHNNVEANNHLFLGWLFLFLSACPDLFLLLKGQPLRLRRLLVTRERLN